jgi:uncharacterized protein YbaP (TraB family)
LAGARKKIWIVAVESTDVDAIRGRAASEKARARIRTAMLARPDQHPDRLLGARDFARLQAATVQRGLPASAARRLKPAVLSLLLAEPACAIVPSGGKPYAEMLVANIAREHAIPVVDLESIAEQLDALDGLPPETERKLLIASMLLADRVEDVLETSVRRYSEGDTGGLLAWMRSREPLPGMPVAGIPPRLPR